MSPTTLTPVDGRIFAGQTLVLVLLAIALVVAFPWPLPGTSSPVAGISASGATWLLLVSSIAALLAIGAVALILRNLASRLLTLGFLVALTATALLLILNDLAMGFVFKRPLVLDGNVLILAGLLGAVAIMRPVANWRADRATLGFVTAVALIGLDQYAVLTWSMLSPGADNVGLGTFPWALWAASQTGLPRLLHLPSGALPGLVLLGLGYVQRKTAGEADPHRFSPVSLGVQLMIAIAFGVAASTALYVQFDAATGAGSLRRQLMMIPLNSALYAAPVFCLLAAVSIRPGRSLWLMLCLAALLPMATWIGQRLFVDWRAAEVARLNATPIDWSDVPIQGRPLMVDRANSEIEARARQRGFADTFSFRYAQRLYVRGPADERFDGPDDFIEVTFGAHRAGRRFAAESGRPRNPAILHVYDVRTGKRTLLGTRIVERYVPPAFPPQLDFDGSWVVDRSRIREADEGTTLMRILDEIPAS